MNAPDLLRAAIARRTTELAESIPGDLDAATIALVSVIDRLAPNIPATTATDVFTGIPVAALGASRALALVLNATGSHHTSESPEDWAIAVLEHGRHLAEAELVLTHAETGFMRLHGSSDGMFEARVAQRTPPGRWRERWDDAWWTAWLADRMPLPASPPLARARALIDRLAYRYDLPAGLGIDGVSLDLARHVLAELILLTDGPEPVVRARGDMVADLRAGLDATEADIAAVIDALTLDAGNARWHATVPGIADPPLVRLHDDRLVVSRRGLCTDPYRFVTRELRRRAPEAWHTAAASREPAFRRDLYALFGHRRFVTSPGRIELRRAHGAIRTDIDAAIFDRKSGTLALFELKSHEPYARSTAELVRTRENVQFAGRQVSAVLDWINRHGADEILNRIDRRTAKGFRVQKVQAFVLGRHLIDGDHLDRRAVWATWPQLLRVLGEQAVEELGGNPVMTLATRLDRDVPPVSPLDITETACVDLGAVCLRVSAPR